MVLKRAQKLFWPAQRFGRMGKMFPQQRAGQADKVDSV